MPVFISIADTQEPCFLAHFTGAVSHDDIREVAADSWPQGGLIFVGFSQTPLDEHGTFNPTRGLLIRIVKPGCYPTPVRSLDSKLRDPYGLQHLLEDEPIAPYPAGPNIGVVGRCGFSLMIDATTCITVSDLKTEVGRHLGASASDLALFAPCTPIRNFVLRGNAVSSLLGVLPSGLHAVCGVFVDARALGRPVALLALPELPFTLSGVLNLMRMPRPEGLRFVKQMWDTMRASFRAILPSLSCILLRSHRSLLMLSLR